MKKGNVIMALQLNLEKATQSLKLCLEKAGVKPIPVDVDLALDVSGSFDYYHRSGTTSALLGRLLPWGLTFDPDKKIGVHTFSTKTDHSAGPLTSENYQGFVENKIVRKVSGYGLGTLYSPVINEIMDLNKPKKTGLLGKLSFGLLGEEEKVKPLLVMFITDGENSDRAETWRAMADAQNSGRPIYFLFVGIGEWVDFEFIRDLAGDFNNAGFTYIEDLEKFVDSSDDELNEMFLQKELITFLSKV